MTNQTLKVLFVSRKLDDAWLKSFSSHLAVFGSPDIVQRLELFDQLRQTLYDVVIIDESVILNDYSLIQQILKVQPYSHVIIVTDTDDWRLGREAFRYRAADYLPVSINQDELIKAIQEVAVPKG